MSGNDKTQYWAAKPIEEIAEAIESKFDAYIQWMQETGYADRIDTAYNAFYGFDQEGSLRITRDDKKGAKLNVNHYKSLVTRLHLLVTENRLAFQPRAKNSDTKSQIESDLAKGICEFYGDSKDMHNIFSEAVLGALIQLEQYVHSPWDRASGMELTADGNETIRTGDQLFEVISPFNCAKNTADTKSHWHILRVKVNKHDTAALHPEFVDEILGDSLSTERHAQTGRYRDLQQRSEDDEDYCWKYILYHDRTPALPDGRRVEVVAGQVLLDDELTYNKAPIFRISAGEVLQTCFGDSPAVSLLPLQEALSALFSATTSNNLNNALQVIWSPDANMKIGPAIDGQKRVTSATKPEALNLTASASENFKMIDLLVSHQQLLSGVNEVARGNPGASVKTSGGQALMIAQAIQYVSGLQKSYARLASDVASCLVSNIQQFASEEMTAYITGSSKKGQIKKFRAEDLLDIERISVDLGNPMMQSFSGRSSMLETWMQYGVIKDPKQIISFLSTGNLDQVVEDQFSDALLIRDENELLREGTVPAVFLLDRHVEHIMSHKEIANSPEARANPVLMDAITAHLQEHIEQMRNVPPDLAAVLSGQPLPPPPEVGPPPGPQEPTVDGQKLPNLPQGMPPEVQANYEQRMQQIPPDESGEV